MERRPFAPSLCPSPSLATRRVNGFWMFQTGQMSPLSPNFDQCHHSDIFTDSNDDVTDGIDGVC